MATNAPNAATAVAGGDHRRIPDSARGARYVESPTAGTLFHKVKFDLLKAFWIVYFIATNKKGFSSTELARKLELGQFPMKWISWT